MQSTDGRALPHPSWGRRSSAGAICPIFIWEPQGIPLSVWRTQYLLADHEGGQAEDDAARVDLGPARARPRGAEHRRSRLGLTVPAAARGQRLDEQPGIHHRFGWWLRGLSLASIREAATSRDSSHGRGGLSAASRKRESSGLRRRRQVEERRQGTTGHRRPTSRVEDFITLQNR